MTSYFLFIIRIVIKSSTLIFIKYILDNKDDNTFKEFLKSI